MANGFVLFRGTGEKFKAVTQAVVVAHNRPQFQRKRDGGERELHGNHFPRFNFAGQSGADAVGSKLGGPSPERHRLSLPEHMYGYPNIKWIAGKSSRLVLGL